MKIILSRKGFDSSAGGVANPILPDSTLVSLPIPDPDAPLSYDQIQHENQSLGQFVGPLTKGRISGDQRAHLDPDLDFHAVARPAGWRASFGQTGAAQGHLKGEGITAGDLFLFFGWFKQTCYQDGQPGFVRKSPDLHLFFGWLQIGEIIDLKDQTPPDWAKSHPHCFGERGIHNTLYVASETSRLPGLPPGFPGAGRFPSYKKSLVLTAPGRTRRYWHLPPWFHPQGRNSCLTYHGRPEWWQREPDRVLLKSAARGQDFVLNCDDYPEAPAWAARIMQAGIG